MYFCSSTMKPCTRGLSTNVKAPILFLKNSKSASFVKWAPLFKCSPVVALSTARCSHSTVHAPSSPVIQSDSNSTVLHIPEEKFEGVEKTLEKVTSFLPFNLKIFTFCDFLEILGLISCR